MNRFFQLKASPWGLLSAAGLLTCLCTVAGFAGQLSWVLDLTSHFRVQYLAALSLLAIAFCIGRKFCAAGVMGCAAALNLIVIAPYYLPESKCGSPQAETTLRALLINVNTSNKHYELTRELIRSTSPDLIILEEVDAKWMSELSDLRRDYPYEKSEPREDNFGIAMFSRYLFENAKIVYLGDAGVPSVVAQVRVKAKVLNVLTTHPLPPGSRSGSLLRDGQLAELPAFLRNRKGPIVLLGDLNVSPWSAHFRKLLRETGLRDSARGRGIHSTWPTMSLLLRVPIDHCLVSRDVCVLNRIVCRDIGSDHYPLLVDLAF